MNTQAHPHLYNAAFYLGVIRDVVVDLAKEHGR